MICHTKALILRFGESALCSDSYSEIYKSTRHSEIIRDAVLRWQHKRLRFLGGLIFFE